MSEATLEAISAQVLLVVPRQACRSTRVQREALPTQARSFERRDRQEFPSEEILEARAPARGRKNLCAPARVAL